MKILHFADVHSRDKDIEEVVKCLNFIVETAEKEKVELIVIAGDIFHSQELKLDSLSAKLAIKTVSRLADIAPVAIVLGTASHDGKAPEILSFARGKYDVHVSSMPEQVYLYQGCFYDHMVGNCQPEAVVSLCPPPHKQFFQSASDISGVDQEIGAAMSGLFAGFGSQAAEYKAPHVLVGHFNVAGSMLSNQQIRTGMDIEIGRDQIALAGAAVVCLGHIHLGQQIGDNIFYSSSLYAANVGEDHPHGFYVHEIGPCNFNTAVELESSRFIETPHKKLARFSDDFTVDPMGTTDLSDYQGKHVVYTIKAWQDEAGQLNKDEIGAEFVRQGALSAEVRVTPVPRVTVRAAEVLKADALRDKIQRRADLVGDVVALETLSAADILEVTPPDQLVRMVMGGAL